MASETQQQSSPIFLAPAQPSADASPRVTRGRRIRFLPKLWASYFSALLVLSVGVVAVVQNHEAEAALARASLLRERIRTVLALQVSLLEAETGERGYLLTEDASFRRPYDAAAQRLGDQVSSLATLVDDDEEQRAKVELLGSDARAKLATLRATMQIHDQGGEVRARIQHGEVRALDERIARTAGALIAGARTERDAETRRAAALYDFARRFTGVGNAFAFALAVAITFWIGRAFREGYADRLEAERHALALERTARQLAEHEQLLATRLVEERRLSVRLERSNSALQKSNADLEFFAYMASHDLRAPLRGIANVSEWIEQDLGEALPPETKRHMDALRGRVHRLESLIAAIAAYARAGKREVRNEDIDLEELMQELAEAFARPAGVELAWRRPLPRLLNLRQPLQQVLSNLVSNAVKHGSVRGGRVEFELADAGEFWTFSVSDHGPGIAPEYHAKIFGLFQTLAARDRVEGAGIGLAIVKKLVDQYGGQIELVSEPGKGASFRVSWPKRVSLWEDEAQA